MTNENNVEIMNEAAQTGTEIVTEVVKNHDWMKRLGKGAGYLAAGAVAYKGIEMAVDFFKNKFGKKKNEDKPVEASEEKTEDNKD